MNYLALGAATVAAFLVGAAWYSPFMFGDLYLRLLGPQPEAPPLLTQVLFELARCLVAGAVFAHFISRLHIKTITGALGLAGAVWVGFQALSIAGSVIHEGYLPGLFAIHAGDALTKSMVQCVILALWRKREA